MTTAGSPDGGVQRAAFLDTNGLVALFSFWDAGRDAMVRLDAISDWAGLKSALEIAGVSSGTLNSENSEQIKTGMRLFGNLFRNVATYQYLTSHVAWSELHHVLLADLSMERMMLRRVPRSVRVKRPQMLFRAALQEADYQKLRADLAAFREAMKEEYGLNLITVEDRTVGVGPDPREIWQIAEEVWSHVLIETVDAYLYAAAIGGGASVFVTSDGSFRSAVNNLWQPQGNWKELVDSLKLALDGVPSLEDDAVYLPQGIGLGDPLPTVSNVGA